MRKLATFSLQDVRQIARDKTLKFYVVVPFLLVALVRYLIPYLTEIYPQLISSYPMIMMFTAIQASIMFGFITSFLLLDEKDEGLLPILRVLPITSGYFIIYRLLLGGLASFTMALITIHTSGIAYPGFYKSVLLSIQYGLAAPLITLVVATFAKNKVEGMACFKGVDLLFILPLLSFLIASIPKQVFLPLPTYWTFRLYEASIIGEALGLYFWIGTLVYLVLITFLFGQFRKRVFDR